LRLEFGVTGFELRGNYLDPGRLRVVRGGLHLGLDRLHVRSAKILFAIWAVLLALSEIANRIASEQS
jgi:hypothetical protein